MKGLYVFGYTIGCLMTVLGACMIVPVPEGVDPPGLLPGTPGALLSGIGLIVFGFLVAAMCERKAREE
jgi:hypothetical protein